MSFIKFKYNSCCVGGKHYSATTNLRGDITVNKKTGMPVKLFRGTCSTCKGNKSLIVSDQTIQAEGLGDFFRSVGKAAKNVGKKILNNPGRALEIAANIGPAAASENPKLIAATAPYIIKFVNQGKGLYKAESLYQAGKAGKGLYRGKFH